MGITVFAPARIDLAGGTTDIYPLYLFMGGGCTVNAAITVQSRVSLSALEGSQVRIVSEDLEQSVEAETVAELPVTGPLGLLGRAVKALPPANGIEMRTRNEAPAGSGLGASSALLVASVAGLLRLRGESADPTAVIDIAANIETAAIGVPTGKQDHIAAAYGGVSLIEFGYHNFVRQSLPEHLEQVQRLQDMAILTYTGQARFSGSNNWEITRAFIDGAQTTRESLVQIRDVARAMCRALTDGNWDQLPALMTREWNIRRTLAPGVSTPRIDAIMAGATKAGALASKICGAGGGGCMITLAHPHDRRAVEQALTDEGAQLIPFAFDFHGLGLADDGKKH
jgi:D-glycero-alpha-D-manno-heptose-7-phosphate kinase